LASEPKAGFDTEFADNALKEIQKAFSAEVVSCVYAKMVTNNEDSEQIAEESKKELMRILLSLSWSQRLYFIARSLIMSIIGTIVTLSIIWYLGTINVVQGVFVSIISFICALFLSRILDHGINLGVRMIVQKIEGHGKLKKFLAHF
jgi:hypothetical protein